MKKILILPLLLFSITLFANTKQNEEIIRVGVYNTPPFVFKQDGHFTGISIDLWEHIAKDNDYTFEYVELQPGIPGLIENLNKENVDIIMGSITINSDRESKIDFSLPYYETYIGVTTNFQEKSMISILAEMFFSWSLLKGLILFLSVLFLFGLVSYIFEKDINEAYQGPFYKAIFNAFYYQIMVFTTIGFGDIANKTYIGKTITILTAILYLFVGATLVGQISSSLTVDKFESSITSLSDLKKITTGTVQNTTSSKFLDTHNMKYYSYADVKSGITAVDEGELGAFVYDKPVLEYYISELNVSEKIKLMNKEYGLQQFYGFGVRDNDPRLEEINRSLLRKISQDSWQDKLRQYNVN
jgi:ABC-type amino acid transport substrate-binding protein